jgi:ribosomal protein S25
VRDTAVQQIREWIAGNRPEFVTTSMMQKRLRLGYAAASQALDELHRAGVVGPIDEANKWQRRVTA